MQRFLRASLAVMALLLIANLPAQAATSQVFSSGALGPNDFFDWGQIRVVDGGGNAVALSVELI